jgi:hypothetical protein
MHEDRPRRGRRLCVDCQYPTLRLDDFEGDSSLGAPVAGNRSYDSSPDIGWSVFTFPWRALKSVWRGGEDASRRKKVAGLRADILPEFPDARICPLCLRVFFPDELRG